MSRISRKIYISTKNCSNLPEGACERAKNIVGNACVFPHQESKLVGFLLVLINKIFNQSSYARILEMIALNLTKAQKPDTGQYSTKTTYIFTFLIVV